LNTQGDDLLAQLYQMTGVPSICLTMGRHGGVLLRNGTETISFAAKQVEIVNTIGAGDAFLAGYVTGILSGAEIEEVLNIAAASGAMTCQVDSATNPQLNIKGVKNLMQQKN
jgi:sugar/nucleoside kinase (ribokinase family)